MIGTRLAAFGLFACAAFAWSPPWLDRPGTAALGFGFAALAVGRGAVAPRPASLVPRPPAMFDGRGLEPVTRDLAAELAAYGMRPGSGNDGD